MRVFVAGASGALGRALVPLLLARGDEVVALARSPEARRTVCELGATWVPGDLLRDTDLADALAGAQAAVHIATAIPRNMGDPDAWETTGRLRVEGTRRLLAACEAAGVGVYVQQSICMAYPDLGDAWIDETTPLDVARRPWITGPVAAMEAMVRAVPAERLKASILRGGAFVGPGTAQAALIAALRAGKALVPGQGRAFVSLVDVRDMASAVAAAVTGAGAGMVLNVTDEPLRIGAYMDALAERVGAPAPARTGGPEPPSVRARSEAARRALGWRPVHGVFPH